MPALLQGSEASSPDADHARLLEHRIARLERINRCLVLAGATLALFSILALASDSSGPPDTIQAGGFQLIDEDGAVRAALSLKEGNPVLSLFDQAGLARLSVEHDATQTALFIRDAAGDVRIGVAQFAHGGGGVALHGPASKGAAVLYLKEAGSLSFYDADGTATYRAPME